MSGSTRIVVIPLKKLIIMVCVIAALIILAAIFIFGGSSSDAAKSTGVNISTSTDTVKKNTSCPTYSPGVYTSSILLNGTPIDIQVTVDSDNINNIEMVNLSESVQTMYPMLNSSFDEIKTAVSNNGSTDNITYNAGSKYTATMLLSAIDSALAKARN